jgi:hypothetical protein
MPQFYKNSDAKEDSYALRGENRPTCILFAEGDAEALFLDKWLTIRGDSPNSVAVICFRGHSNLETILKRFSADPNFEAVERFGFYLDAEATGANVRAKAIAKILGNQGIIPAGTSLEPGTLLSVGKKRIAVFVSPDNANPGCIEDVVIKEIMTTSIAACITGYRECLASTDTPLHSKGFVQAYLSARNARLAGTGRGFEAGVLDVMHPAYAPIRDTFSVLL